MSYAGVADFYVYGIPATASSGMTTAQIQGALDSASSEIDGYFKGRPYALPLLAWGVEVKRWNCVMAAWELIAVRGFNPASGADPVLRTRYVDCIETLKAVQRKAYHPDVTESLVIASPGKTQPRVFSQSVTTSTGTTSTNRGWLWRALSSAIGNSTPPRPGP